MYCSQKALEVVTQELGTVSALRAAYETPVPDDADLDSSTLAVVSDDNSALAVSIAELSVGEPASGASDSLQAAGTPALTDTLEDDVMEI